MPRLIAHRGYAARFPENTLLAVRRAIEAGAGAVEFDVQLSADGVAVLMHDADLARTAGRSGCVMSMGWSELQQVAVGEPSRFGESYASERIPSLTHAMSLLADFPAVTPFVEIKRESLRRFGADRVLAAVLPHLDARRCVLISFDAAVLMLARARAGVPTGWVLAAWDEATRRAARAMAPQFLFCDRHRLPAGEPLWDGGWQWAAYEVDSPARAVELAGRGFGWLESMQVERLLQAPPFVAGACA